MELYHTRSIAHFSNNKWANHQSAVQARFEHSPDDYRNELRVFINAAVESEAEALILPACAIILDETKELSTALNSLRLADCSLVLCAGGLQGNHELAIIKDQDKEPMSFDSSRSVVYNTTKLNLSSAISTSVKTLILAEHMIRWVGIISVACSPH